MECSFLLWWDQLVDYRRSHNGLHVPSAGLHITVVCLLPEFLILKWNVPFYFGGTSLLIIVVVTMDFMSQVQAYIMSHRYEGLLKKANFKGVGIPSR
jgi:preprotein translocase subunit SecY